MATKSTEKVTQAAILEFLRLKKIFHWRNNTGAYKTQTGGFVRYGTPGSPDIMCILKPNGHSLGIEVKDVKGYLNANQKDFKERLEAEGGTWITAKSVDDVIEFFDEYPNSPHSRIHE